MNKKSLLIVKLLKYFHYICIKLKYNIMNKSRRKYTREHFYALIYAFHTLDDKRQTSIAEATGFGLNFVDKSLTEYFNERMNLSEMVKNCKDEHSFISICIESEMVNKQNK